MGIFGLFKVLDINEGVRTMKKTGGAVLLDVRTHDEYADAHIPGSLNIPLGELQTVEDRIPGKGTPFFVHCFSGGRSRQAVQYLKQLGYTDVTDLGGIRQYQGALEKGGYR